MEICLTGSSFFCFLPRGSIIVLAGKRPGKKQKTEGEKGGPAEQLLLLRSFWVGATGGGEGHRCPHDQGRGWWRDPSPQKLRIGPMFGMLRCYAMLVLQSMSVAGCHSWRHVKLSRFQPWPKPVSHGGDSTLPCTTCDTACSTVLRDAAQLRRLNGQVTPPMISPIFSIPSGSGFEVYFFDLRFLI